MKPYFYKGRFSSELVEHVIHNAKDFQNTMRISVEAFGGRLVRCHVMASGIDPIGFVDFPSDIQARAWNAFYLSQNGVLSSTIERLLDESDLEELGVLVNKNKSNASVHRKEQDY